MADGQIAAVRPLGWRGTDQLFLDFDGSAIRDRRLRELLSSRLCSSQVVVGQCQVALVVRRARSRGHGTALVAECLFVVFGGFGGLDAVVNRAEIVVRCREVAESFWIVGESSDEALLDANCLAKRRFGLVRFARLALQ